MINSWLDAWRTARWGYENSFRRRFALQNLLLLLRYKRIRQWSQRRLRDAVRAPLDRKMTRYFYVLGLRCPGAKESPRLSLRRVRPQSRVPSSIVRCGGSHPDACARGCGRRAAMMTFFESPFASGTGLPWRVSTARGNSAQRAKENPVATATAATTGLRSRDPY